jgi:hypothetical protein
MPVITRRVGIASGILFGAVAGLFLTQRSRRRASPMARFRQWLRPGRRAAFLESRTSGRDERLIGATRFARKGDEPF